MSLIRKSVPKDINTSRAAKPAFCFSTPISYYTHVEDDETSVGPHTVGDYKSCTHVRDARLQDFNCRSFLLLRRQRKHNTGCFSTEKVYAYCFFCNASFTMRQELSGNFTALKIRKNTKYKITNLRSVIFK